MIFRIVVFHILILTCSYSKGQGKYDIIRKSEINLKLNRKEIKNATLNLKPNDFIVLEMRTLKKVNFRFLSPEGNLIKELLINGKSKWTFDVLEEGLYSYEIENLNFLLDRKFSLNLTLNRPKFIVGGEKKDPYTSPVDRTEEILGAGMFRISRFNDKTLSIGEFSRGDSLLFEFTPKSGKTPDLFVTNSFEELLLATRKIKKEMRSFIPILDDGLITASMSSDSYLGQTNDFSITKITPFKYLVDSSLMTKKIVYDSLPVLMMDSVVYLGAQRDYVNKSEGVMYFDFQSDSTVAFWTLLYGAGKEFRNQLDKLLIIDKSDSIKRDFQDLILAYLNSSDEKLPDSGNKNVNFYPSDQLTQENQESGSEDNFFILNSLCCNFQVKFENHLKSTGQKLYFMVLGFQLKPKEAEF